LIDGDTMLCLATAGAVPAKEAAMKAGEQHDHYRVLGVSRTETMGSIRSVYRGLVRRFHADRLGEGAAAAFGEINQAYAILSDVRRRAEHDRELRWQDSALTGAPDWAPCSLDSPHLSILGDPQGVQPSYQALHDRFQRNFTDVGVPKSEHLEALNLDVALSTEEAARGVMLRLGVPVFEQRPGGVTESERDVSVSVPPLLGSSATIDVPLDDQGIFNLYLHVRLLVTDQVPRGHA
jgi:hypothetical protein